MLSELPFIYVTPVANVWERGTRNYCRRKRGILGAGSSLRGRRMSRDGFSSGPETRKRYVRTRVGPFSCGVKHFHARFTLRHNRKGKRKKEGGNKKGGRKAMGIAVARTLNLASIARATAIFQPPFHGFRGRNVETGWCALWHI